MAADMARAVLFALAAALSARGAAGRCEDAPGFRDQNGLACSTWEGLNCSSDEHLAFDFYSPEGLSDVQGNCTVTCAYCEPPPYMYIEPGTRSVRIDLSLQGVQGLTVEGFQAAMASAMSINASSVAEVVVGATETGYDASCYVVVATGTSPRPLLDAAESLTGDGAGAGTHAGLKAALDAEGVDTTGFASTTKTPAMTKTIILLKESEAQTTLGIYGVSVPETAWCADDPTFLDEQGEGCEAWIGYDCTDSKRWLGSERAYTANGLERVRKWCGSSCMLCRDTDPVPEASALQSTCSDDPAYSSFCARWKGLNCSWAEDFGYSAKYQEIVLSRCPMSCGTCDVGAAADAAEALCEDNAAFVDELGRQCSEWQSPWCFYEQSGYTRQGMHDVQANCPMSCGMCSASTERRLQEGSRPTEQFSTCEDDPEYSYIKLFRCADFVGQKCTMAMLRLDQRWMTTPEGRGVGPWASYLWHERVWEACPVSCGLCDPAGRVEPDDLLIECEDDEYYQDWCAYRWSDQDCASWRTIQPPAIPAEADRFNETLFGRCPSSCGLCEPPVCPAGSRRDKVSHTCTVCDPGYYAPTARSGKEAADCIPARPGDYVRESNATGYERCEPGSFSGAPGSDSCETCPAGYYSDQFSASVCVACDTGWFQNESGSSFCFRCEQGTFADGNATTTCTECPAERTTFWLSATSLDHCGCPEGTYQPEGKAFEPCEPCLEGLRCPGGHSYGNAGADLTPILLPGMMALSDEPHMIYSCWGNTNTCPEERPLPANEEEDNTVCDRNRVGVRCASCPDNYWQKGYECRLCEDAVADTVWKAVVAIFLQFCAVAMAYRKQGKETTAMAMMLWAFLAFVQVLVGLSKIPVAWPKELREFFDVLKVISIPGFFSFFEFRHECLFGTSTVYGVARDALIPLLPFANFLVMGLIFMCFGKRLHIPYVANVIAAFVVGLFVTICAMAVQMFPAERMPHPNNKIFVRALPGTELYSQEWYTCFPITIAACIGYCGFSFVYVIRGVIIAPKRVLAEPSFAEQYDFILGDMNPRTWWWIVIAMTYALTLALIQAFFTDVFMQLYLSMLCLSLVILVQIACQPNIHHSVNNVEVTLLVANLIFLVFATSFIKEEDLLRQNTKVHAVVMIGAIAMAFLVTLYYIWRWVRSALKRTPVGKAAIEVYHSRDIMTLLSGLPEGRFLSLSSNLIGTDRELLQRTTNMLVATFLRQQPDTSFRHQHIIQGAKYTVWKPHKTAKQTHKSITSRATDSVLEENRRLRMRVKTLYDQLRKARFGPKAMCRYVEVMTHKETQAAEDIIGRMKAKKDHAIAWLGETRLLGAAFVYFKQVASVFVGDAMATHMSFEQFETKAQEYSSLTSEELRSIYDLFDISGEGKAPVIAFFELLQALAHEEDQTRTQYYRKKSDMEAFHGAAGSTEEEGDDGPALILVDPDEKGESKARGDASSTVQDDDDTVDPVFLGEQIVEHSEDI